MKSKTFTEPLFRAAVAGTKTQFREIIKPQPDSDMPVPEEGFVNFDETCGLLYGRQRNYDRNMNIDYDELYFPIKPRYEVGDKIYLKEPYSVDYDTYLYDHREEDRESFGEINKLFLPEKFARYFIEITAVRCERVQDICDSDCVKEGIREEFFDYGYRRDYHFVIPDMTCPLSETAQDAFGFLFDHLHGKGAWEANPYVFVYEFQLIKE